jgi:hypothetical protein
MLREIKPDIFAQAGDRGCHRRTAVPSSPDILTELITCREIGLQNGLQCWPLSAPTVTNQGS